MKILHRSRNKLDEWPPLHREKWIVGGISTRSISRPLIHSKLSRPWKAHNFPKLSREVVSNFRESGDRSKNSTFFFYFLKKTIWWIVFKNNIQKYQWVFILKKNMKVRNRPFFCPKVISFAVTIGGHLSKEYY